MELSKQVCSLEQAKLLKGLGVTQNNFIFEWSEWKGQIFLIDIMGNDSIGCSEEPIRSGNFLGAYRAFTVAELGVMLPHPSSLNQMGFWLHNSQYDYSESEKDTPWYCMLEFPNEKYGGTHKIIKSRGTQAE